MNPLHRVMKSCSILLSAFAFTSAALLAAEPAPRLPLPVSAAQAHAQDVRFETKDGGALRITTGIAKPWPGVTILLPDEVRDLSRFHRVALDVSNGGDAPVTVHCRVDNSGADGTKHYATGQVTVAPGRTETLGVAKLHHLAQEVMLQPRLLRHPAAFIPGVAIARDGEVHEAGFHGLSVFCGKRSKVVRMSRGPGPVTDQETSSD